ncbi:MAG: NAD-dependent protein deacylase [Eubacteriales bacterium]|nr:NAD-dependent protein deacylase [Eubacteriales bacterium]
MGIDTLQKIISGSDNIVFFGGAGVSTESGIPDFRSVDGLYHQRYRYPPETILSRRFFDGNTAEFYAFYKEKILCLGAKPNDAHKKLAALEKAGKLVAVITQNIDGLHRAAGSANVLELHGSVYRNYCRDCSRLYDVSYVQQSEGIPMCACGGVIKPDVVLYGEELRGDVIQSAIAYIKNADVLIIGGTSLAVYPAAGLIDYYKGGKLVLINRSATPYDARAHLVINGSIGETLGQIAV